MAQRAVRVFVSRVGAAILLFARVVSSVCECQRGKEEKIEPTNALNQNIMNCGTGFASTVA